MGTDPKGNSMQATDGISRRLLLSAGWIRWPVAAIANTSIVFALAIGLFLIIRRAAGTTTSPLPIGQLLATVAGLTAWAIGVRVVGANRRFNFWGPLCVMMLFAVACSFPANHWESFLAWLPAIALIAGLPLVARWRNCRRPARAPLLQEETISPEHVLQQLTRLRTPAGKDAIRGTLVAEFAAGERQVTLYVGFCPPFELLPEVETNVADDFEADVKLAQVLHNGAQIDVRLSEPADEPVAMTIEFFAIEPAMPSSEV
jgi:hypothetical protein